MQSSTLQPALAVLIAACLTFVGSHLALSHPLRGALVRRLGEQGFLALYSLVAFASLGWMAMAFRAVGAGGAMAWDGTAPVAWIVASLLTLLALVLLFGSLIGNPALPQMGAQVAERAEAKSVFAVTRHPMMWGFALWAMAHMLVAPTPRVLVLAGSVMVLALVGAHLQDAKKAASMGGAWTGWEARTHYWPRLAGLARVPAMLWIAAAAAWLAITWLHMPAAHVAAGLWRWF